MIGMNKVPCISNDELDEALAASRRHAAFTASSTEDGQVQGELRMIAARADHIASHGPSDLHPQGRHPILPRTARRVVAACVCLVFIAAVASVAAARPYEVPIDSTPIIMDDRGPQDFPSSGQHLSAGEAVFTAVAVSFVLWPLIMELLAKGSQSLDRYVTRMRARRQHGDNRSKRFGKPHAKERNR